MQALQVLTFKHGLSEDSVTVSGWWKDGLRRTNAQTTKKMVAES